MTEQTGHEEQDALARFASQRANPPDLPADLTEAEALSDAYAEPTVISDKDDQYTKVREALRAIYGVEPALTFPTTDDIETCVVKAQQALDNSQRAAMEWLERALVLISWRRAWDAGAYQKALEQEG